MDAYENLITRRSTRKFNENQVDKELVEKIIYAGQCAPTGMNRQPLIFVVIQEEEIIHEISRLNAAVMDADIDPFYGGKTLVVVFANKDIAKSTYICDGSLAIGNMLNAAHALGVNAIWVHRANEQFASEQGQKYLKKWNIEEGYVGIGNCVLGYGIANDFDKPITSKVVWEL